MYYQSAKFCFVNFKQLLYKYQTNHYEIFLKFFENH